VHGGGYFQSRRAGVGWIRAKSGYLKAGLLSEVGTISSLKST
jgi:hypothetical protein